jgi:hypothetical protein
MSASEHRAFAARGKVLFPGFPYVGCSQDAIEGNKPNQQERTQRDKTGRNDKDERKHPEATAERLFPAGMTSQVGLDFPRSQPRKRKGNGQSTYQLK